MIFVLVQLSTLTERLQTHISQQACVNPKIYVRQKRGKWRDRADSYVVEAISGKNLVIYMAEDSGHAKKII